MTKTEKLEVMVLAKLHIECVPVWSHWRLIEECFNNAASPNKCLDVVRQLREDNTVHYFCGGCGVDVTGPMWCDCGEFVLFRG
jgi:hypothetical protein